MYRDIIVSRVPPKFLVVVAKSHCRDFSIKLFQFRINCHVDCDQENVGDVPENCAIEACQQHINAEHVTVREYFEEDWNDVACESFELCCVEIEANTGGVVVFNLREKMFDECRNHENCNKFQRVFLRLAVVFTVGKVYVKFVPCNHQLRQMLCYVHKVEGDKKAVHKEEDWYKLSVVKIHFVDEIINQRKHHENDESLHHHAVNHSKA